jgi:PIN domain nuclease of toxin-antitoxin system
MRKVGFQCLDITVRHALAPERIKTSHADPFESVAAGPVRGRDVQIDDERRATSDERLTQLPVAVAC